METSALYWILLTALLALPVLVFVYLTIKGFSNPQQTGRESPSRHYWQGFWTGGLVFVIYLLALNWLSRQIL